MLIGDRVKEARIAAGLSVEELAARIGRKPSTIYDLERGDSKSSTKLHAIAAETGFRVEYLETGRGLRRNSDSEDASGLSKPAAELIAMIESADRAQSVSANSWKHLAGLVAELSSRKAAGVDKSLDVDADKEPTRPAGAKPTPEFVRLMNWAKGKLEPKDIQELMFLIGKLGGDRGGRNKSA